MLRKWDVKNEKLTKSRPAHHYIPICALGCIQVPPDGGKTTLSLARLLSVQKTLMDFTSVFAITSTFTEGIVGNDVRHNYKVQLQHDCLICHDDDDDA